MLRKLISEHSFSLGECTRGLGHGVVDMRYASLYEKETEDMGTHLQRDAAQRGEEVEHTILHVHEFDIAEI